MSGKAPVASGLAHPVPFVVHIIRLNREKRLNEIPAVFYRTAAGNEPVIDWLRGLAAEDRRTIGTDLATVQFGWPVGLPICRPLGSGLWEVRSTLRGGRIARLMFFIAGGQIGVVHGFMKKTQKTPADDLELARRRMKEMLA